MNYKTEENSLLGILLWVNADILVACETGAPLATHTTHVEPSSDRSKAAVRLKQGETEKPG